MIIGVDAGALSISDDRLKVGVWRVSFELLKSLSRIDKKNIYRLYSFSPIPQETMSQLGVNMKNIVLMPSVGFMKVRLPIELTRRPVDVFLGLSQCLPRMRKGKKIGFVYDIGFLSYPSMYGTSAEALKKQTHYLMKKADHIITISDSVKKDIHASYTCLEEYIHVCHPGVSRVFSQNTKKEKKKYPYFLFVGSLRKGKNIPDLIQAFQLCITKYKLPHHLILVGGDYWKDESIDTAINTYKVQHKVHSVGHVSDAELARLYKGATAFVTMSRIEGFCIPIVEAFASGCPVIASDIDPIRELVGSAGILVDPNSVHKVAVAMGTMATDVRIHQMYEKRGMTKAKKYTWNEFAKGVYKTFSL
jgi:glycosyltransferase involved in cell wall biosynthesis